MYINSEGIIFRQVKTAGGRRMILLFTKKYGKISAGSNINEKGRNKSALALRPFTYGNYELYKKRDFYNLNSGEVINSFFKIGEDVDKYMQGSFVLELTEKVLAEDLPQPRIFNLLVDFLQALVNREKRHETLVIAYEVKLLELLGTAPVADRCVFCGGSDDLSHFSVKDGGMVCKKCLDKAHETLIYEPKFDIVNVLKYFSKKPIRGFEKIALDTEAADELQEILREYFSYHLDVGNLKSEFFFNGNY